MKTPNNKLNYEKKTLLIATFLCCVITSSKAQVVGVDVGDIAPEIDLPDTKGEKVALSSLRGTLVLVDFWASWCGPCIKEQPLLIKLNNAYPDKLSIYGVSMDTKKPLWTGAIAKGKLPWTNVSDLKYWQSPVVGDYMLQSVPLNFLIDKNGIILAKNIHGQALEAKIKELLEVQ
ncbi:TlpA family protein disulfide reductase [Flavobacterium sp. SH_e]|uniref:TlpA family protein disulfide reductase n=1 Tax=Flavobacterium sp. SH_e TaxID=2983767 RepID=UPI0021E4C7EE|nr:TlpA disulfide reductase family protein [Flavobacterium sp. SH_e]MCV2485344.1 TlpA family protein disulfide reductase [Flavobacterium sp. SH_e]